MSLPLLHTFFPSNAEYFITFIVDISNFNVIPTDKILDKILNLKQEAEDAIDSRFANNGYKHPQIIKNVGLLFLASLLLALVITFLLLIRSIALKYAL